MMELFYPQKLLATEPYFATSIKSSEEPLVCRVSVIRKRSLLYHAEIVYTKAIC